MMIVLVVVDCPPKLRGDLSKWFLEINTGVYVGNLNSRVRDEVWQRVCDTLKNGRATIVFHTSNEQKLDFRVHNTTWEPVNFDGIKLIRRPVNAVHNLEAENLTDFSKAAIFRKMDRMEHAKRKRANTEEYVVIDVETTGLSYEDDTIIELGAIRVSGGKPEQEFSTLVRCEKKIPLDVANLTGITDEIINANGREIKEALIEFINFIGTTRLVGYNITFDQTFLHHACLSNNIERIKNSSKDVMALARKKLNDVENYKLSTVAVRLGLDFKTIHRALDDCYLTYGIYEKLKEM